MTKVLSFVGGADGLMRWACELGGQGVLWALRNIKSFDEFQSFVDSGSIMTWAKERAIRCLEDEQRRVQGFGKKVHFGIECRLTNRPLTTDDWNEAELTALETFETFNKEINFQPYVVEGIIFSPLHRYAGQLDMAAVITEEQAAMLKPYLLRSSEPITPGHTIIDFKTGSFYHDAHGMQLAAYSQGGLETHGVEATGGLVINIAREAPNQVKCFYYSKQTLDDAFLYGFLPAKTAWEYAGAPKWYKQEMKKAA